MQTMGVGGEDRMVEGEWGAVVVNRLGALPLFALNKRSTLAKMCFP